MRHTSTSQWHQTEFVHQLLQQLIMQSRHHCHVSNNHSYTLEAIHMIIHLLTFTLADNLSCWVFIFCAKKETKKQDSFTRCVLSESFFHLVLQKSIKCIHYNLVQMCNIHSCVWTCCFSVSWHHTVHGAFPLLAVSELFFAGQTQKQMFRFNLPILYVTLTEGLSV